MLNDLETSSLQCEQKIMSGIRELNCIFVSTIFVVTSCWLLLHIAGKCNEISSTVDTRRSFNHFFSFFRFRHVHAFSMNGTEKTFKIIIYLFWPLEHGPMYK